MDCRRLDHLDASSRWDAYVDAHPQATVYHLSAWARIVGPPNRFKPRYLALEDSSGSLRGVLPLVSGSGAVFGRRFVSLPATRCTGPLANSREEELALVETARALAAGSGAASLEIRSLSPSYGDPQAVVRPEAPTWRIELPDSQAAFLEQVKRRSRRLYTYLRGLDRSPLSLRWSDAAEDLVRFYALYLKTMRRLGELPRSFQQFRLWRELLPPRGVASLLLAERNGELIAAAAVSAFGDTVDLPYAASDRRRPDMRANYLLCLGAIRWAIDHGYRRVEFGAAVPGSSLAAFKSRWTAEPTPRFRHLWLWRRRAIAADRAIEPTSHLESLLPPLLESAWRHAPVGAIRLAGELAYRYL